MQLAPIQHQQFRDFVEVNLKRLRTSRLRPEAPIRLSARYALDGSCILSGGIYGLFKLSQAKARGNAARKWQNTFTARWVAPLLPSTINTAALAKRVKVAQEEAALDFLGNFAFSRETLRHGGKWWTLFTNTFTHITWDHLMSNFVAAGAAFEVMGDLPGMNALHMLAITFGCSLVTGVVALHRIKTSDPAVPMFSFGFSGVVCALNSIALLGAPRKTITILRLPGTKEIALPYWCIGAMQLFREVALTVQQRKGIATAEAMRIDTLAHLAGYAFGAVYYMTFLRHWESASDESRKGTDGEIAAEAFAAESDAVDESVLQSP